MRPNLADRYIQRLIQEFSLYIRNYFDFSQHAVFTKRILFSALSSKTNGICEGTSKQSPDLKNYTAPGPRPPFLKFLDPPLQTFMTGELQTCSYFKILQTMIGIRSPNCISHL